MPNNTERAADPTIRGAFVIDRVTGATTRGVILPPLDSAGQDARLAGVGLMSAGLAHDLGNLMQIIDAGLRSMERRFGDTVSPDVRVLSQEVRGAAQRAAALTRRILNHSRGDASEVDLVDVGDAILQMRALIGWAAGPAVRVVLEVEPHLPPTRCALAELESAVINLVVNARHAMLAGGALTVSVCRHGQEVMLRVADTGCGMSPAAVRHACEPFFTTRPRSGGSGLGLATVGMFIRAQGGTMEVDSTPGRGTAIVLTFCGAGGAAQA
ncbi:ATP-binding protein [Phenylobacterium sp.]|jgi:signal transduction histidine kinase|uniref:sensor histidine kinase n=1 Tax=Phenylobacterium sp. TaxID=1871053 RepID=UPI0012246D92|nr:ATP-binding protein [Phenylobacterium sp.]THD51214.1 MAG: hypothetical protein E8A12_21500 [Phenylobacterium sp.]